MFELGDLVTTRKNSEYSANGWPAAIFDANAGYQVFFVSDEHIMTVVQVHQRINKNFDIFTTYDCIHPILGRLAFYSGNLKLVQPVHEVVMIETTEENDESI